MASIFGERAHGDAQGVEDVVELLGVVSVGRSSSLESSSAANCSIEPASIHRLAVALSECSGRRCRHVMHAKNCASGSHLGRVGVRAGRCPRSATFASSKRAAGSPQGSRISPLEARRVASAAISKSRFLRCRGRGALRPPSSYSPLRELRRRPLEAASPSTTTSHAQVVCPRPSLRQLATSNAASRCAGAGSTDAAGSASAGCSSGRACAGLGQQRGV